MDERVHWWIANVWWDWNVTLHMRPSISDDVRRCFLIAIRERIHKTTSPPGSAAATCLPLRQKSSHFSTRSRGWRSTAREQSNTHTEWDRRLLQPPHHFPDFKYAASLRLWLSRMFVASVDVKLVRAKFRLKIFPKIIIAMIFTWRFPHNISHYLPLNVVSAKTPLMVRDEFYIQMSFHLKIHVLIS